MDSTRTRRVTALVLALAFVVATTPLAGATQAPTAGEAWTAAVLDSLAEWLADLWPGAGREGASTMAWAGTSTGREPAAGTEADGGIEAADGPIENPERGGVADPNG